MAGKFLDPLDLEFIDGKFWRLTEVFDYRLGSAAGAEYVRVPRSFVTDFASIPRGLWNLLPPTGGYGKAAVIHDWLYQKRVVRPAGRLCDRAEADRVLLEGMEVLGVGRLTRRLIYAGVRAGGWATWNKYRKQEHSDLL